MRKTACSKEVLYAYTSTPKFSNAKPRVICKQLVRIKPVLISPISSLGQNRKPPQKPLVELHGLLIAFLKNSFGKAMTYNGFERYLYH